MDFSSQLLKEHSRANANKIAKAIGSDKSKFKNIIDIIYNAKAPLPQRASWILAVVNEKYPELLEPYLDKFIDSITSFKIDGIKRNMLHVLSAHKISVKNQGKLINICFDFILSSSETVAVKVHAMQCIANIAKEHRELIPELKAAIDDQLSKNTVAFHARARMVLKKLEKI